MLPKKISSPQLIKVKIKPSEVIPENTVIGYALKLTKIINQLCWAKKT